MRDGPRGTGRTTTLLRTIAELSPRTTTVLLLIDDADQMDPMSHRVLGYLLRRTSPALVSVLAEAARGNAVAADGEHARDGHVPGGGGDVEDGAVDGVDDDLQERVQGPLEGLVRVRGVGDGLAQVVAVDLEIGADVAAVVGEVLDQPVQQGEGAAADRDDGELLLVAGAQTPSPGASLLKPVAGAASAAGAAG